MKVLGITGQVGAGKSTILAYLEEKYRAKVIQADQVGHLVMEPDTDRKSTRLNSSHSGQSRMPSSA